MVSFSKQETCEKAYDTQEYCGYFERDGRWFLKQYSQSFALFIYSHAEENGKLLYSKVFDRRCAATKRNLALYPKTLEVFSSFQGKKRDEIGDILKETGEWKVY